MTDSSETMADRPYSVVVAEDLFLVREMIAQLLGEHGCMVHKVATADQLLAFVREHHVDAVITDDSMPPGTSGIEALRAIHQDPHLQHLRLVLISGTDNRTVAEALGAYFLEKPFVPDQLLQMLELKARS